MSARADCVIVGAGVVGLAIARQLAQAGREVLVLEAEARIGSHTSSRNSEVIHSGIYYPRDSLKARLCVAGKRLLYRYCADKRVPHKRLGKLIIANGETEIDVLRGILNKGLVNGVADLEWLTAAQVQEWEPDVRADAAILSPSTGILDSHALMVALHGDVEAAGGLVLLNHRVTDFVVDRGDIEVHCEAGEQYVVRTASLVNAAGLWASDLARQARGVNRARVPKTQYAKGHYYDYGRSPFRHLIYPVPIVGGLGIHATNDLNGRVRFGPDAEWVADIDYAFDGSSKSAFVDAVTRYYPGLKPDQLRPAYTGVRPKLYSPGEPPADFVIQGPDEHGVEGLVNLFGIESPGLTSCLAIAGQVQETLGRG